jgi:hypothetical protein
VTPAATCGGTGGTRKQVPLESAQPSGESAVSPPSHWGGGWLMTWGAGAAPPRQQPAAPHTVVHLVCNQRRRIRSRFWCGAGARWRSAAARPSNSAADLDEGVRVAVGGEQRRPRAVRADGLAEDRGGPLPGHAGLGGHALVVELHDEPRRLARDARLRAAYGGLNTAGRKGY